MANILIADDEKEIVRLLRMYIEANDNIVFEANDGQEALRILDKENIDLAIVDIMMPKKNGYEIIKEIRKERYIPILVISAKVELSDRVFGMDLGADDYLAKPYHIAELSARIKTIIRRKNPTNKNGCFGNVCILSTEKKVLVNNQEIILKKKEFEILEFFSNRMNRLIDNDKLAEFVWGEEFESMGNYDFLYAQMKNLRKKLKDSNASLELKSIYGLGYKLIEKQDESSI